MRLRSLILFCLALLAPGSAVSAQTVFATVRDSTTSAPIRGAFVEVVGSTGNRIAAGLSDSLGQVRFEVELGAMRLHAEAAEYADAVVPLQLAPGEQRTLELDMAPHPAVLPAKWKGSLRCGPGEDTTGGVSGVWTEVRKTLRLASWTMTESGLALLTRRFERTSGATPQVRRLNPDRVRLDTTEGAPVYTAVTLIIARERGGNGEDSVDLDAPTPESILSRGFTAEHCFSARRVKGRIALEFYPVRGAPEGEASGTVWLGPDARTLREIDFSWRLRGAVRFRRATVRYEFTRSPEGYVFIRRWTLGIPTPGRWVKEVGREVVRYWMDQP